MFERNIFNNFNAGSMNVTVAEYAAFSLLIYGDISTVPAGWCLLNSYAGIDGYLGACYARNLLTTNAQVVFVHRGTVLKFPDGIGDIISDIEIAMGNAPLQCRSIGELMHGASDQIRKIYRLDDEDGGHADMLQYLRVASTGHSLGAVLSDCLAMYDKISGGMPSITFENPGSKPILQKILNDNQVPVEDQLQILAQMKIVCQVYQAGVNIINTCNEQVGRAFRIQEMDYSYKWDKGPYFPITSSYRFNPFYVIGNTFDQHRMAPIYDKVKSNDFIAEEIQNPIGYNAGYVDYLDEKNNKYWETYFTAIWDNSPGERDEYKNDKDKYLSWCFEQLKRTQSEARSSLFIEPKKKIFNTKLALFQSHKQENEEVLNDFVIVENINSEEKTEYSSITLCNYL